MYDLRDSHGFRRFKDLSVLDTVAQTGKISPLILSGPRRAMLSLLYPGCVWLERAGVVSAEPCVAARASAPGISGEVFAAVQVRASETVDTARA